MNVNFIADGCDFSYSYSVTAFKVIRNLILKDLYGEEISKIFIKHPNETEEEKELWKATVDSKLEKLIFADEDCSIPQTQCKYILTKLKDVCLSPEVFTILGDKLKEILKYCHQNKVALLIKYE